MSDKNYIPASGETFLVRRAVGNKLQVQQGQSEPTSIKIEHEVECIDHQTQRILWAKSETARRLFWIFTSRGKRVLSWPGGSIELDSVDLTEGSGGSSGKLKPLKLTMPGKVAALNVKEGDLVEPGQGLVIVEAMKMENLLLATARARIGKIHVSVGERLESGALLITFESLD